MKVNRSRGGAHRGGAILYETTIAVLLAATVVAGAVQLTAAASQQRRIALRRSVAVTEAGNVMEEWMVQPWDEVRVDNAAAMDVSAWCRSQLPDPQLRVTVTEESDGAKRIHLQLDWQGPPPGRARPVALVAWRYPPQEAAP